MSRSLLRYPGGKSKFFTVIIKALERFRHLQYREPFFGGGSVGLEVIARGQPAWINDVDRGIVCLWQATAQYPEQLKAAVMAFRPSLAEFDRLKSYFLSDPESPCDRDGIVRMGCDKLALHRMSWSGAGTMGGAYGGRMQTGRQQIDGRWNPERLCRRIDCLAPLMADVRITSLDYSALLLNDEIPCLIYLDPPYYEDGARLYQHAFDHDQHVRLRDQLRDTAHQWVLSYDDCPQIRELYQFAHIREITVPYSLSVKDSKKELLIERAPSCPPTWFSFPPA